MGEVYRTLARRLNSMVAVEAVVSGLISANPSPRAKNCGIASIVRSDTVW